MDLEPIIVLLAGKYPMVAGVLALLGILVVVGQVVVVLTPTKKDDEALAKWEQIPFVGSLLKVIAKFAPIQKK
jgi:hypothetical protein